MRVVGNSCLVHIEGKRFLQAKTDHRLGFGDVRRQYFEIQKHDAHRCVRQDSNHIAGTIRNTRQRFLDGVAHSFTPSQVVLDQIGNHAAGR